MLNEQLSDQIEQEAESNTLHFKDVNDYDAGRIGGYKEGYEAAGVHYAALWQEAEQRAERAEKALREVRKWELATGAKIKVNHLDILKDIMKVVNKALAPKTSEDGR